MVHRFFSIQNIHRILRLLVRHLERVASRNDRICKSNIRIMEGLQQANILLDKEAVWATKAAARLEALLND